MSMIRTISDVEYRELKELRKKQAEEYFASEQRWRQRIAQLEETLTHTRGLCVSSVAEAKQYSELKMRIAHLEAALRKIDNHYENNQPSIQGYTFMGMAAKKALEGE